MTTPFYIGCAGWGIPAEHASDFEPREDADGRPLSHLERYAKRLAAVEINSSFYRAHRPATYARWAESTPDFFRFAVKVPRQITHIHRLRSPEEGLSSFFKEAGTLESKLGPILVQLPPSLVFDEQVAAAFFEAMRDRFAPPGSIVCEPRHPSWFQPEAEQILKRFKIARAAVDPVLPVPEAAIPGGWGGLIYYRLHGSPRTYYSAYSEEYLQSLAQTLTRHQRAVEAGVGEAPAQVWCIFDNTALGAATADSLRLAEFLESAYPGE